MIIVPLKNISKIFLSPLTLCITNDIIRYVSIWPSGVDDGEVPPVPIPNTEVKLTCADDTRREASRENR